MQVLAVCSFCSESQFQSDLTYLHLLLLFCGDCCSRQSHSSSVFSIKADAFAYGALVLSNSDRAAGREIAKMVFFYNPRGPALASLRSRESVDLILAASLPRGGGHTALAKLCTLNADLSADLPVGVDVTVRGHRRRRHHK